MAAHSYMPIVKRLYSLAQSLGLPVDFTESTTAPHPCTIFIIRASVGSFSAEVRRPNRREAKTQACLMVLKQLEMHRRNLNYTNSYGYTNGYGYANSYANGYGYTNLQPHERPDFGLGKDPCTRLSELLMARKHPPAQYRLLEGTVAGAQWVFSMEVSLDQCTAVGKGGSKKEARRRATAALLQMMGYIVPEEELVPPAPQTTAEAAPEQEKQTPNQRSSAQQSRVPPAHIPPDFRLEKDPTTRLSELQMVCREKAPEYRLVSGELVNGSWVFTMEVSLNQFTASGSGPSKKEAKRSASTALLLMMGFRVPEKDLIQEKPVQKSSEKSTSDEAPVRAAGSEAQTSEECCETLLIPDQKNQKDSHSPRATTDNDQEKQPLNILGSNGVSEETSQESHRHSSHRLAEDEQSKETSAQIGLEELKIIEKHIPETVCAFLNEILPLKVFVKPENEFISNNCSVGHQTLGETSEIHKMLVDTPEKLETLTETQDQEEAERLKTPENGESPMEVQTAAEELNTEEQLLTVEDVTAEAECKKLQTEKPASAPETTAAPQASQTLGSVESLVNQEEAERLETPENGESPMEVQILEVPEDTQSLDNPKSPEEDQNPQDLGPPEGNQNLKAPNIPLKTPNPEEPNCPITRQDEDDSSSEAVHSPTEPQTLEDQTPEYPNSPVEVQKHLQTGAEALNTEEEELHTAEDVTAEAECERLQTEEPASAPETTAAPQASQTLGSVESLVIQALVKKLLQKLPSKMRSHHDTVVQTLEKALDQFKVPDEVYLKPSNIKKLGKAGARDLINQYGSASELLTMALGPEPSEFQKDAVKHLNIRLTAFRNRPRTLLARLFPQWDKPKKRAS